MSNASFTSPVDAGPAPKISSLKDLLYIGLAALGVVYGDIGTSPLYAIRECFNPPHGVSPTIENVLGILSLVFWMLTLVVVNKYLTYVMRADNQGEGGIMALLALITPKISPSLGLGSKSTLILLGLVGTSLLFAEGMITPAISVLSAIEGLEVATPVFRPYVIPITLIILITLFLVQRYGTAGVASVFGPAMLLWFLTLAGLGIPWILQEPTVLYSINPVHAIRFFIEHGWHGFLVLGAVVLCITGTEALYADMGLFGLKPIRFAWYMVVFPALLINYWGQGAIIIARGAEVVANPFYALAPEGFLYPTVIIATVATVIASQALISGSYSLAQQAMQLGYSPRLTVVHTSSQARGQIYLPEINTLLMIVCSALVLQFRSSSNLAAAYGMAVTGTMVITSILMRTVMRERWEWNRLKAYSLVGLFLCVDIPLFTANLWKFIHGGWVPLVIGGSFFIIMTTWKRGRGALAAEFRKTLLSIDQFMPTLPLENPVRVKGTAVFMTSNLNVVPPVLLHHFKHNKVLHEQVILLYVVTEQVPEVSPLQRLELHDLGLGFYQMVARYGFMEQPNVPELLASPAIKSLNIDQSDTSYYLGRETLLTSGSTPMSRWRKGLFAYLSRNARTATAFFGIPPNRVVEMGMQVEL